MSDGAKPTYLKREELIGKSVVSADASIMGTVEDLVATAEGKMGFRIIPKNPSDASANTIVGSDDIQAMGDVILLKPSKNKGLSNLQPPPPPSPITASSRICSRCGYANTATSRFCIKCGMKMD